MCFRQQDNKITPELLRKMKEEQFYRLIPNCMGDVIALMEKRDEWVQVSLNLTFFFLHFIPSPPPLKGPKNGRFSWSDGCVVGVIIFFKL